MIVVVEINLPPLMVKVPENMLIKRININDDL